MTLFIKFNQSIDQAIEVSLEQTGIGLTIQIRKKEQFKNRYLQQDLPSKAC